MSCFTWAADLHCPLASTALYTAPSLKPGPTCVLLPVLSVDFPEASPDAAPWASGAGVLGFWSPLVLGLGGRDDGEGVAGAPIGLITSCAGNVDVDVAKACPCAF